MSKHESESTSIHRVGLALDASVRESSLAACYDDRQRLRQLIRESMVESGLGVVDPDVPLRDVIAPGNSVLLKPNWVYHLNQAPHGNECLVTHPEFVLAAIEEVLAARPGMVTLGDAPIQGCDWNRLVDDRLRHQIQDLARSSGCPIEVVDFRRTISRSSDLGEGVETLQREDDQYVLFDLGSDSWLEPISEPTGRFRVTDYDPKELAKTHRPGRHQYLLCREVFESDVVIQLPKLKTHRKAGITGAIKNLVGLNGNKDYLPHHRIGGSANGGDCYAGSNLRMRVAEWLLDAANQKIGSSVYGPLRRLASFQTRLVRTLPAGGLEGSWHGNDTCWRMVLDLNRIVSYGTNTGEIADSRQRTIYSLTDAIVCGQGDGPLNPEPLQAGFVTFSANAVASEWVHCWLTGLDPEKIPLVRNAFTSNGWPLIDGDRQTVRIGLQGREVSPDQVVALGVSAKAPSGWQGKIELEPVA